MAATYSLTLRDDQYEFLVDILAQLRISNTITMNTNYEEDFLNDLVFNYLDKAAITEL